MRPGNPNGWKGGYGQKGKGKGINGMMMEDAERGFPPLATVTNESECYGCYGSYDEYNEWGNQEQGEWYPTRSLAAVTKGKGNYENPAA